MSSWRSPRSWVWSSRSAPRSTLPPSSFDPFMQLGGLNRFVVSQACEPQRVAVAAHYRTQHASDGTPRATATSPTTSPSPVDARPLPSISIVQLTASVSARTGGPRETHSSGTAYLARRGRLRRQASAGSGAMCGALSRGRLRCRCEGDSPPAAGNRGDPPRVAVQRFAGAAE